MSTWLYRGLRDHIFKFVGPSRLIINCLEISCCEKLRLSVSGEVKVFLFLFLV
jgi:hypothetical protein